MQTQDFAELFEQEFAEPLRSHGFGFVGQGRSLRYVQGNRQLLILRMGGRLMRPGTVQSVICIRHTFLRPIQSEDPKKEPIFVEDCPRKLTFDDFRGWRPAKPNYRPENSGRWPIHTLGYAGEDARRVRSNLGKLATVVTKRIVPWANSLTEEGELSQIERFGEGAWCEKRWIEDYEQFLGAQS